MVLVVTGASGHVGQEIVRQASARGMRVLAVSRSGLPANDARKDEPNVVWEACDLSKGNDVYELARRHPISACIHGAAVSNEAYARPDPLAAVATNISATASVLEAARRFDWRRVILISTGSVFQCRPDIASPILEDEIPAPRNIYSTSKVAAEMLVRMYRTEFGASAASVRISWVYGPPVIADAPTRGPVPSYLLRAMRGNAIEETGADFAASFTYVGDVAAGLLAAATADHLAYDVYHLGPSRNYRAIEVAEAVRKAVPTASFKLSGGTEPWTKYTLMRAPLAGDRLKQETGFELAYTLEDGVAAYAEWMRGRRPLWAP
ncbi:MAG: NAD-dependent epimerase/dehydratase family protein [Hyphomicrobiaceae bacterium]